MKQTIDFNQAIPAAFAHVWQRNLERRAAGDDFRGNTYYVTASDVEEQVRCFAEDQLAGKPWGTKESYGRGWHNGLRISGDLTGAVRQWLLRNCDGHNFGRGHISGMRFRPRGEPIGPAEATLAKQAAERANPKVKPVHYSLTYGPALCVKVAREKRGLRYWGNALRSRAHTVSDWEHVTCKRCLNLRTVEENSHA